MKQEIKYPAICKRTCGMQAAEVGFSRDAGYAIYEVWVSNNETQWLDERLAQ
jgi:hypothetical protein